MSYYFGTIDRTIKEQNDVAHISSHLGSNIYFQKRKLCPQYNLSDVYILDDWSSLALRPDMGVFAWLLFFPLPFKANRQHLRQSSTLNKVCFRKMNLKIPDAIGERTRSFGYTTLVFLPSVETAEVKEVEKNSVMLSDYLRIMFTQNEDYEATISWD